MYKIDVYADTSSLFKTLLPCSEYRSFHSGNSDPRNRVLRIRSQDDVTSLNDFAFDTPSQDSGLANLNRMIYDVHPDVLGLGYRWARNLSELTRVRASLSAES